MSPDFADRLLAYWSVHEVQTNLIVFANLLGALFLGSLVGYERAFHGRAAGMRTYGLVCMAAAGLTVISGQPESWFGGAHTVSAVADPTRVIQGIVTGVGFLGAGVIVKEGLNISGLTTAASIWTSSCIGILVGVGFYAAAMLLTGLSAATMLWGSRVEAWLPAHPALRVGLKLTCRLSEVQPKVEEALAPLDWKIAPGSFALSTSAHGDQGSFIIVAVDRRRAASLTAVADTLRALGGVGEVSLEHARN